MADYVSTFPLSSVYKFPVYQTREQFAAATGLPVPPYDPRKPVKSWFDPAPVLVGKVVMYKHPVVGADGRIVEEPFLLSAEDAKIVNIPPKAPGVPDQPTVGEVPVPVRDLLPNESYITTGPLQIIEFKDTSAQTPGGDSGGGFTSEDRRLLQGIAKAVGVS